MEGKAGLWATRQMQRMEAEMDVNNKPPKELYKMANFWVFFMTQFGDEGLIDKVKMRWSTGITQTGRVVDYFKEIETIIL